MSELSSQPAPKRAFASWAIVEVMGHTRVAGRCTEESIAGVNMLRVDVPEVTKETYGYNGGQYGKIQKQIPAYTRYFGGSSIFSITPCSEEVARASAASNASEPPIELALPQKPLLTGSFDAGADGDDVISDDELEDIDAEIDRAVGEGMPAADADRT